MKGRGKVMLEMLNKVKEPQLPPVMPDLTPVVPELPPVVPELPPVVPELPTVVPKLPLQVVTKESLIASANFFHEEPTTDISAESEMDDSDADPNYVNPNTKRRIVFSPLNSPTPSQRPRIRTLSSSSDSSSNSSCISSTSSSTSSSSSSSSSANNNFDGEILDGGENSVRNLNHETNIAQNNSLSQAQEETVKGKKKGRKPETWKATLAKTLKNSGKPYKSRGKLQKEIPARKMRPPCGEKCRLKCATNFNETTRQKLFDAFWELGDLQRQREYIVRHTHEIKPKYRYSSTENYRALNTAFYYEVNNSRIRVCKNFFKATLDLGDQFIKTAINKKSEDGFIEGEKRGTHKNHPTVDPAIKESVFNFINSIPRVESHYLRAQTTREFIQCERSLADIYRDYKGSRQDNDLPYASESTFQRIFNFEFNIGFFSPKKDLCDLCESYKNADHENKLKLHQAYEQHLLEKDLARTEKEKDKKESGAIVSVYDLQAVMQIPKGQVSLFFYKSRINCYNFTVSDLHAKNVNCFFWDETEGKRGAIEIGSCVLAFIEMKLNNLTGMEEVDLIFYSDNCCGQQKNKYLLSAYAYAVSKMRVRSITHKFLVRGHSQNEGDNVHSVIEKQVKRHLKSGPIYSPQQYVTLIRSAKKSGPAYQVQEMTHDCFYDLKALQESWGTNFNTDEDNNQVKWHDIKVLKVEKESPMAFFYKTSFAETQFKKCLVNKRKSRRTTESTPINIAISLNRAYTEKLTLSEAKKKDIKELVDKNVIPKPYYDSFYKNVL